MSDFNSKTTIEFGQIIYNPANRVIINGETKYKLQKKANNVLQYLIENSDRVVTREELIDSIWSGNYYVGDKALSNTIWKIRNAFENGENKPIETISKKGYRFILTIKTPHSSPTFANKNKRPKALFLASASLSICITAFSFFLYLSNQESSYSNELKIFETSSITADIGQEFYPVISPAGDQVLYIVKNNTDKDGIYIKAIGSELSEHILLDMQQSIKSPTWSLDGKSIVFSQTSQSGTCEVIKFTINTRKKIKLNFCEQNFAGSYSLSHSGGEIAYVKKKADNDFPGGIFIKDLETNQVKQLTYMKGEGFLAFDLNWSLDDSMLAYTEMTSLSSSELFVIKSNGNKVQLTYDGKNIRGHTWSPAGDAIIFSTNKEGKRAIWSVALTDKKQTNLGISGNVFHPNLSRDGKKLVFEKRNIEVDLSSINTSNSIIQNKSSSIGKDSDADYSSTNNKIVFNSDRSGNMQIWMSNLDGSTPKQLTSGTTPSLFPKWSNQGDKITYIKLGENGEYDQVFVYDFYTGESNKLSKKLVPHLNPTWSMSGNSIYESQPVDSEWNIWRHPVSGGSPVQLTRSGGVYGIEFFDGKTLYFSKNSQSFIWKLDLESGLETKVFDTNYIGIQGNWTISMEGIYFLSRNEVADNIKFFRFSDKKIDHISALPLESVRNGTFSLAKSKLLYTRKSRLQSDIILARFEKPF